MEDPPWRLVCGLLRSVENCTQFHAISMKVKYKKDRIKILPGSNVRRSRSFNTVFRRTCHTSYLNVLHILPTGWAHPTNVNGYNV